MINNDLHRLVHTCANLVTMKPQLILTIDCSSVRIKATLLTRKLAFMLISIFLDTMTYMAVMD